MRVLFVEFSFEKLFNSGVAALAAILRREGHSSEFLRVDHRTNEEEFVRALGARSLDLLAFSAMSFQWPGVKTLTGWARRVTSAPILVGGYHPTFWPDQVIDCPSVDMLCRGEGEGAILDLARALDAGEDPTRIPNLWVKKDGDVVKNECRPLIAELDTLPHWEREFFQFDELLERTASVTIFHEKYIMPVAAGRGCPYNCTYCSNHGLMTLYRGKGKLTRVRSVDYFLSEIRDLLERYPQIRMFEFWDEIFGVDKHWLREFSVKYGSEFHIPFTAFLRVELATEEVVDQLAYANCKIALFGVEQGNEDYRKRYLNRRMSNKVIVDAFRRCRERNIETVSLSMLGLPYETAELVRETIQLNREIDPDIVWISIFQAYPGTDLFDLCVKEGYVAPASAGALPWYENPSVHIEQESITHDELMECYHEFRALQSEIERKRNKGHVEMTAC
ncbi:MAG: B12-binding domain-containing radical SAM protein [Planctomycetes bacterium]|nr:B12-binding domain-containing radical SAM protein [Planctomycetota bacterium]MBI3847517.1 B12-binding domain-containing radical SAM protein [Planctomycetota bacterium]